MPPGDTARLYHRLTSYGPDRDWPPAEPPRHPLLLSGFRTRDLATFTAPCKSYGPGLPTQPLPKTWPEPAATATETLAGRHTPAALDRAQLARILFLSAGVVRTSERADGRFYHFRAAGSAGGRFPLEVYVADADGVHWYDPINHALQQIGPPPDGDATTLIVTGIPWRTGWQYAERGFRHLYWDAGTMLAQTLALAGETRLYTRFPDEQITRLVGADGIHEFPLAVVALEPGDPKLEPTGDAATGAVDKRPPLEFPLITEAQHAGDRDTLGEPLPMPPPLDTAPPQSKDLDRVILERGSTRRMDPDQTVPRQAYEFSLRAALRGIDVPHYVAVHGVDGLAQGLYKDGELRRPGNLRDELLWVTWDQDLGRDAAYVVIGATDVGTLDDRGYREAQLQAGIVEGRLHIAAYALGHGATGMTFLDSEIEALLGEPLDALLFTCVGVPAYKSKGGGRPGEPVKVVTPTSGLTELKRAPNPR
jgi:hypothetical protein